jgi:hypothetical protein
MILLEFLKQNAPNPSCFSLWDVAKSTLPKPTLSLGIPLALAAMPSATAVSELAAAQFVTPTEASAPRPPTEVAATAHLHRCTLRDRSREMLSAERNIYGIGAVGSP